MKILTSCAIFIKAIPESMFQFNEICWKSIGGFFEATYIYVLLTRFPKAAS
jgi:hypothetical protein